MNSTVVAAVTIIAVFILLALPGRIVMQYEKGVLFRLGRLTGRTARTTLRQVAGPHPPPETLAATDGINADLGWILDTTTLEWGVRVILMELKDIQLPDAMKR